MEGFSPSIDEEVADSSDDDEDEEEEDCEEVDEDETVGCGGDGGGDGGTADDTARFRADAFQKNRTGFSDVELDFRFPNTGVDDDEDDDSVTAADEFDDDAGANLLGKNRTPNS